MTVFRTLSLACILSMVCFAAEARTRHVDQSIPTFDRHAVHSIGSEPLIAERSARKVRAAGVKQTRKKHQQRVANTEAIVIPRGEAQLLPHPVGCPASRFCGCGASIEVFGKSIRELWLARAWFKFPRTSPAP